MSKNPKSHSNSPYQGKKFLITQPIIYNYNGSTLVTLELATFLQSQGAKVIIYTSAFHHPAKQAFQDAKLTVITANDGFNYQLNDFDYVWVHSQIIPPELLEQLHDAKTLPCQFIFLHMSPLKDEIPDESPWIYDLEKHLASLRLVISEANREVQNQFIPEQDLKTLLFPNPVPPEYLTMTKLKRGSRPKLPHHALLVSNHPPKELEDGLELVKKAHPELKINRLHTYLDAPRPISPQDFRNHDVVITIGKTVQYGLVSGIPIFLYDHYGGFGYLNDGNLATAKYHNFSGRVTGKKYSAEEIADQFISNYPAACKFATTKRSGFQSEYSLAKILPKVLQACKPKKKIALSEPYLASVIAAERVAINYFKTIEREFTLYDQIKSQNQILTANSTQIQHQKQLLTEQANQIATKNQEITTLNQHIQDIYSSHSYKAGNLLMQIPHKVKALLHPPKSKN